MAINLVNILSRCRARVPRCQKDRGLVPAFVVSGTGSVLEPNMRTKSTERTKKRQPHPPKKDDVHRGYAEKQPGLDPVNKEPDPKVDELPRRVSGKRFGEGSPVAPGSGKAAKEQEGEPDGARGGARGRVR